MGKLTIDLGHGGADPGAIGPTKACESVNTINKRRGGELGEALWILSITNSYILVPQGTSKKLCSTNNHLQNPLLPHPIHHNIMGKL